MGSGTAMDSLCDEILQLIFFELNDPTALVSVSRRFYQFSCDPYIRAHYFLVRYGPIQAMYYAFGRGKLVTERVLDILIASGAHLSRYFIQIAMHHFFHTQSHFIKSPWVRTVPFSVFAYFLKLASEKYGDIPRGKGEDDGSIFTSFIKESRFPSQLRTTTWESVRDILQIYQFIPFSSKDPIMVQFPLALAIEPRLLPYAAANGFCMDSKYRDFIFRKMFEQPSTGSERGVEDIVENVKELIRLDSTMFLSRTVAAEICMEARQNEVGYAALKELDASGYLLFELRTVVEDLLKLFLKARSSTNPVTMQVLRHLYSEFPSSDPAVRLVLLLGIFVQRDGQVPTVPSLKAKLDALNLGPLTRIDLYNLLINPFMEKYGPLLEYMKYEVGISEADGKGRGMSSKEIKALLEEVAARCLEMDFKGKMLKKLHDTFSSVHEVIVRTVLEKYQIRLQDLPDSDDFQACRRYRAPLCKDFFMSSFDTSAYFWDRSDEGADTVEGRDSPKTDGKEEIPIGDQSDTAITRSDVHDLGEIGLETLTTMIRQDELLPSRSRRRYWTFGSIISSINHSHLPVDPLHVGKWVKSEFGPRSSITAVFMLHAVLNENAPLIRHYLMDTDFRTSGDDMSAHVPVTLKHFEFLAHLGRAPSFYMYADIQSGAEFFRTEDDYITRTDPSKKIIYVLRNGKVNPPSSGRPSSSPLSSKSSRKRPRRSAAASVRSYTVPDSDEDDLDMDRNHYDDTKDQKTIKIESNLQMWIKHLGELLRAEQAKHREKKRHLERNAGPDEKVQLVKSEFLKSLSSNLRLLKKYDAERRTKIDERSADEYYDTDDDDYAARFKKRRTYRT